MKSGNENSLKFIDKCLKGMEAIYKDDKKSMLDHLESLYDNKLSSNELEQSSPLFILNDILHGKDDKGNDLRAIGFQEIALTICRLQLELIAAELLHAHISKEWLDKSSQEKSIDRKNLLAKQYKRIKISFNLTRLNWSNCLFRLTNSNLYENDTYDFMLKIINNTNSNADEQRIIEQLLALEAMNATRNYHYETLERSSRVELLEDRVIDVLNSAILSGSFYVDYLSLTDNQKVQYSNDFIIGLSNAIKTIDINHLDLSGIYSLVHLGTSNILKLLENKEIQMLTLDYWEVDKLLDTTWKNKKEKIINAKVKTLSIVRLFANDSDLETSRQFNEFIQDMPLETLILDYGILQNMSESLWPNFIEALRSSSIINIKIYSTTFPFSFTLNQSRTEQLEKQLEANFRKKCVNNEKLGLKALAASYVHKNNLREKKQVNEKGLIAKALHFLSKAPINRVPLPSDINELVDAQTDRLVLK